MKRGLLKMRPCLLEKVWGSHRLQREYGKDRPTDVLLGESWEVSALAEHPSGIDGEDATLDHLFESDAAHFLGPERAGGRFPMLIKLLATSDLLSVQVHPDDEQALAHIGRREGKWECWTILEAEPGAEIFLGLAPGVTEETFFAGLAAATPERVRGLLRRLEVRPGDFYVVPPGTIHAIGAGITLLEVQQPSDVTYRVYDWGRKPNGGPPRPLHLVEAREVIDPNSRPAARRAEDDGEASVTLWDEGAFRIERHRVRGVLRRPVTELTALVTLAGRGTVRSASGEAVTLVRGESCVVPRGATMIDLEGGDEPFDVALIAARNP